MSNAPTIRALLRLLEDVAQSPGQPASTTIGATGLQGSIDARGLAQLLPTLTDISQFISAVGKVREGKESTLSVMEKNQLAEAFISLLADTSAGKYAALSRMLAVQAAPGAGASPTSTAP